MSTFLLGLIAGIVLTLVAICVWGWNEDRKNAAYYGALRADALEELDAPPAPEGEKSALPLGHEFNDADGTGECRHWISTGIPRPCYQPASAHRAAEEGGE